MIRPLSVRLSKVNVSLHTANSLMARLQVPLVVSQHGLAAINVLRDHRVVLLIVTRVEVVVPLFVFR